MFFSSVAHAAAKGLDYPGVHGAPDFYGPAHHGMHPRTMPFRPQPYNNNDGELAEAEPNMASYRQNQLGVRSPDDRMHKRARPGFSESTFLLSHGAYNPVQSEYTADQVFSLPRGQSVINRESNFEEVKHVAPLTLAEARGQPDLVNRDPQGRNEPLSFVYNERDLVVDESVPNRRGMSLSGLPPPQSRGRGTYQRGLTGYDPGREVPVLGSARSTNEGRVRAMTSRGPAVARPERIRFPGRLAQPLHRSLNVKQFVQGSPVLRHLTPPKSGPVRISR